MISKNIEMLVAKYEELAGKHGSATTSHAANTAAKKIISTYLQLRKLGAQSSILPLLASTNPSVRCWAATYALEFATKRAVEVLESLAAGSPGAIRADAAMALREYRAGRLKFPN